MTTPLRKVPEPMNVDFYEGLRLVAEGRKIARREWANDDCVLLHADRLHLRKSDGSLHQLLVSRGDIDGLDWFVRDDH